MDKFWCNSLDIRNGMYLDANGGIEDMAQGKKFNDDIKERAIALLACNKYVQYVAGELSLKLFL